MYDEPKRFPTSSETNIQQMLDSGFKVLSPTQLYRQRGLSNITYENAQIKQKNFSFRNDHNSLVNRISGDLIPHLDKQVSHEKRGRLNSVKHLKESGRGSDMKQSKK